jgi:DNA-binding transcriptional MerR regulator
VSSTPAQGSATATPALVPDPGVATDLGLRIGDVAARASVSTRTLRYYEELGLLQPSGRTLGGERRYEASDLVKLGRIIELKDLVGMNLEKVRVFLASEDRLAELREDYRAHRDQSTKAARDQRRAILEEAFALRITLIEQLDATLARITDFRAQLQADAERCRQLLNELG